MSLSEGTKLGPYEITGQIGAGGMGEVYRATDTKLGREVAVKTLPASLAQDADRLVRFEREARLLASLNHAHIAVVYDLDEHEGTRYIAMELVEGETLERKLEAGALPVESALEIALQIALALEAAHEKGVIHRDLKPANVMVTPDGVVKVLDFGLAKAFAGDPNDASPGHSPALSLAMTQQGLVLGTAGYMSPEQASGQATDQRADIWAFGVVVYEMLTGRALFGGESVPHILADVLRSEPDWKRLPERLHPRIRQMLERCLDKKPRSRYAGIADARVDIEVALKDPHGVTSITTAQQLAPAPSVPRRLLPWAAGLGLAVAAGVAAFTLRPEEPREVFRAVYPMADETSLFAAPNVREIDISADGRQMVFNFADGLYLRQANAFDALRIPGVREGTVVASPVFSPDGANLALFWAIDPAAALAPGDAGLRVASMPAGGGAPVPFASVDTTEIGVVSLSWEQNGDLLFSQADGIWRVSANGGEAERIVEIEADERVSEPRLLPGGEWVLFSLANEAEPDWDTAQIVVESLATHERRVLRNGGSGARYAPTGHLVYAFGSVLYGAPFDLQDPALTGGPVQLVQDVLRSASTGIAQYAFSANGTLIYAPGTLSSAQNGELAVFDRTARVTRYPMPGGNFSSPRVSPDGLWAAMTATFPEGDDIVVYALGSNATPRRLTFGGTSRWPLWSADSTRVAFQSTRDGTGSLYWQLADGSDGTAGRLTTATADAGHMPDSFSPDGAHLSYTVRSRNGGSDAIWLLDLGTGETSTLVAEPGRGYSHSVFSPDGRWFAYQSTEPATSLNEIFVQPYPPTGARYQLPHTLDNHHPAWSADGTELFYIPGPARFEVVPIRTEPRFEFGAAVALPPMTALDSGPVSRRSFDVMPDGSGLLGVPSGDADPGSTRAINIVYNWFEELKARVPAD